ncbi:hypothetical protein [Nitrospirillum iridis]|uniref:Uncharacterized protein n=1 Tax=Nitrospirillum iridis TaxID=765888 RepID=A0A7X0AX94_9PROT|nr:hypothetical protein [Nitrospirillum iridis]MBB6251417.1 hypothetical protein [Nitrospirillum iridis]
MTETVVPFTPAGLAMPAADALTQARALALALCRGGQLMSLVKTALMMDGLPGEGARQNVLAVQALLREQAERSPCDAPWIDPVIGRLQGLLDGELMRRSHAIRARAARVDQAARLKEERVAGPGHQDPLQHMLAKGSLGAAEIRSADEIRAIVASHTAHGWAGHGAIDPSVIKVDGGKGGGHVPVAPISGLHPAAATLDRWLMDPAVTALLGTRPDGVDITVASACLLVICQGVSCSTINAALGVRRGTVGAAVARALKLYPAPPAPAPHTI